MLVGIDSDRAIVEPGIGGIGAVLGPSASDTVWADVGIDEASAGPFPDVGELRTDDFAGDLGAVIGEGDGTLVLDAEIGSVTVEGMVD